MEPEFTSELRWLFYVFGGGIALFVVIFAGRLARLFLTGHRVAARVVKVEKREGEPENGGGGVIYHLEYHNPEDGSLVSHQYHPVPFGAFQAGDQVRLFVGSGKTRVPEIVSCRTTAGSMTVILVAVVALVLGYRYMLG